MEAEEQQQREATLALFHYRVDRLAGQFKRASKQANQSFIQYGNFWKMEQQQLPPQQQQEQHVVGACVDAASDAAAADVVVVLGVAL